MSDEQKVVQKKFTPLYNLVVVDIVQGPTPMHGNLVIPETAKDKLTTPICRVIAVGPECKFVKEGDIVLCHSRIEQATIYYDGDETFVISETAIYGYIDKYRTEPDKPEWKGE